MAAPPPPPVPPLPPLPPHTMQSSEGREEEEEDSGIATTSGRRRTALLHRDPIALSRGSFGQESDPATPLVSFDGSKWPICRES